MDGRIGFVLRSGQSIDTVGNYMVTLLDSSCLILPFGRLFDHRPVELVSWRQPRPLVLVSGLGRARGPAFCPSPT